MLSRAVRALAIAAVAGVWPALAAAQPRTLTGTVTDDTGAPVSGAIVTISCAGRTQSVNTDGAGRFATLVASSGCDIVTSRFGFRTAATHVEVGPFMRAPVIVLQRTTAADFAIGQSPLRATGAPTITTNFGSGWRVTSNWNSGREADDMRNRTFQRVAGGARWQTESKAGYTSASGFRIDTGLVVRHGYGAPLFMSRPFADEAVLPELFPTQDPAGVRWDALFTLTTPGRQLRGIDLSGSFQAYLRLDEGQSATKRDRGLRASIHFKFK